MGQMINFDAFIKWLNEGVDLKNVLPNSEINEPPPYVYHYTNFDGLQGILANNAIWLSDRAFMNDSSEGCYILRLCKNKEITSALPEEIRLPFLIKCLERGQSPAHVSRKGNLLVLQCSFSDERDNLPMWNYYATQKSTACGSIKVTENIKIRHKLRSQEIVREKNIRENRNAVSDGFNIGFNTEALQTSIREYCNTEFGQYSVFADSVIYDEEVQKKIINAFLQEATKKLYNIDKDIHWAPDNHIDILLDCIIDKLVQMGVFFKHKGFEYEKEYRVAIHVMKYKTEGVQTYRVAEGIKDKINWRPKGNCEVPYLAPKFSKESLVSITSSPLFSEEQVPSRHQEVIDLLEANGYRDQKIKISHSQIPFRG